MTTITGVRTLTSLLQDLRGGPTAQTTPGTGYDPTGTGYPPVPDRPSGGQEGPQSLGDSRTTGRGGGRPSYGTLVDPSLRTATYTTRAGLSSLLGRGSGWDGTTGSRVSSSTRRTWCRSVLRPPSTNKTAVLSQGLPTRVLCGTQRVFGGLERQGSYTSVSLGGGMTSRPL